MDAQAWIVGAIALGAAWFVLRRLKRSWQGHGDGACDKCAK